MSQAIPSTRANSFWREREFWLLLVLVAALYFPRLADQTIRGEESRWATVAQQMLTTGDFLVPRQQGLPFPDRPPLHCWSIAACMSLLGPWNLWAIRLPSVLAMFGTCTLIYGYGRRFLSPLGALASGVVFATMAQVLQLGRLAESDSLFTCLLASSLLVWHWGYMARWSPLTIWVVGYSLAALAALTKGPQAPVYFIGATGCYLVLVRREFRTWFCWQNVVGAVMFVALLAAWQIPFALALGLNGVTNIWTEEDHLSARFDFLRDVGATLRQWSLYPLKLLAATFPWSPLLACYLGRWIYRDLGPVRPYTTYLATCLAVALPTCWLPVHSTPRYFMPLYPCVALLIGLAVERCITAGAGEWWSASWRRYLRAAVIVVAVSPLLLIGFKLLSQQLAAGLDSPWSLVILFSIVALGTASTLSAAVNHPAVIARQRRAILLLAGFCGFAYLSIGLHVVIANSADAAADISALKQQLPSDVPLVSFGRVHHLFAYYYRAPIEQLPWPSATSQPGSTPERDAGHDYFCFSQNRDEPIPVTIPFPWEPVATISCDRNRHPDPKDVVIIGRRKAESIARRNDLSGELP